MNTNLKCILIDDELPGLKYLKMLCEQIDGIEVVRSFTDTEVLLEELPQLDFDLCILDIEMPGMNGLTIANLLKNKLIIFVTAYKEYAVDAFELNAVDYLQKPVRIERLQTAITKALEKLNLKQQKKNFIRLNTDKGKALLSFDQITFIKASDSDSRDKVAFLSSGKTLVLKNISLEKLLQLLPSSDFCQVNKRELIAMRCVLFFTHNEISTSILHPSGAPVKLLLGEAYRNAFLKKAES